MQMAPLEPKLLGQQNLRIRKQKFSYWVLGVNSGTPLEPEPGMGETIPYIELWLKSVYHLVENAAPLLQVATI